MTCSFFLLSTSFALDPLEKMIWFPSKINKLYWANMCLRFLNLFCLFFFFLLCRLPSVSYHYNYQTDKWGSFHSFTILIFTWDSLPNIFAKSSLKVKSNLTWTFLPCLESALYLLTRLCFEDKSGPEQRTIIDNVQRSIRLY